MGIPTYFRYLFENYGEKIVKLQPPSCDYLYFDFNSILYKVYYDDIDNNQNETILIQNIFKALQTICDLEETAEGLPDWEENKDNAPAELINTFRSIFKFKKEKGNFYTIKDIIRNLKYTIELYDEVPPNDSSLLSLRIVKIDGKYKQIGHIVAYSNIYNRTIENCIFQTIKEGGKWAGGTILANAWYWAGNEPNILSPWMFNFAGKKYQNYTVYWTRWLADNAYGVNGTVGLPGNDDFGTLSTCVFGGLWGTLLT